MTSAPLKILLVDDEEKFLNSIAQRMRLLGFDPLKASQFDTATVNKQPIKDAVFLDDDIGHCFLPSLEPAQRPRVRAAGIVQLNFFVQRLFSPPAAGNHFSFGPPCLSILNGWAAG